jgi:hypothetical protein
METTAPLRWTSARPSCLKAEELHLFNLGIVHQQRGDVEAGAGSSVHADRPRALDRMAQSS